MNAITTNSGAAGRKRQGGSWPARIGSSLLGVLLALVCTEVLFRLYLRMEGQAYSAESTQSAIEQARLSLQGGVGTGEEDSTGPLLSPFFGWWDQSLRKRVDIAYQKGSRASLSAVPAALAKKTYDVWILGGSVAAIFGRQDVGGVRQLKQSLLADSRFAKHLGDRELRILGLGHASHKQPQQVNLITFMLSLGLEPDAIINLDGFNEVAVAMANSDHGVHPVYPSFSKWGSWARNPLSNPDQFGALVDIWNTRSAAKRTADRALKYKLTRSAVLGYLLRGKMDRARLRWNESLTKYTQENFSPSEIPALKGPEFAPQFALGAMLRAWFECSKTLAAICSSRGIYYLHVLQPTLHDEDSKPWSDEERRLSTASESWLNGVHQGYPKLRELGQALGAEGIAFLDASMTFAGLEQTLYYDACHFGEEGNRILGDAIARGFVERLPAD